MIKEVSLALWSDAKLLAQAALVMGIDVCQPVCHGNMHSSSCVVQLQRRG